MANQSIQRAARILSLFTYSRPQWRVSDIARTMELPVGTVHGIVQALEEEGFIARDRRGREYRLGIKLHILGSLQKASLELNQKASIPVSYMARETGLIGRAAVFYDDAIVLTMSTVALESGSASPYMGPTAPAFCSALGRSILAFMPEEEVERHLDRVELVKYTPKTMTDRAAILKELEETRQRGYSVSRQELLMHLDSIGAPVRGPQGEIAGAISLNGDPKIVSGPEFDNYAQRVMNAASEISNFMGYHIEPQFVKDGR